MTVYLHSKNYLYHYNCGSSSVGRASAFQAECREFESRLPLYKKSLITYCYQAFRLSFLILFLQHCMLPELHCQFPNGNPCTYRNIQRMFSAILWDFYHLIRS